RGQAACMSGEVGVGLLRFVECWRSAIAAGSLGEGWQHTARTSLSAWQRRYPRLLAVFSHAARVTTVAFSPDGATVITGSWDDTPQLWDASSSRPIGPPLSHRGPVYDVAFSPDGRTVVTGGQDETARFWEAATGRPIGPILKHESPVRSVAF